MVVALSTFDCGTQPDRTSGVDAVHHRQHTLLLGVHPRLNIGHRVAMKTCRHSLRQRCTRQQIAGKLLDREPVKRQIVVEHTDHPVAPAPRVAATVSLIAVAVGIPCCVHPRHSPSLAVTWRSQQPVDQAVPSTPATVRQKQVDLGRSRRDAEQIERHSTNQRLAIRHAQWLKATLSQTTQYKRINRIANLLASTRRRNRHPYRLAVGPMRTARERFGGAGAGAENARQQ